MVRLLAAVEERLPGIGISKGNLQVRRDRPKDIGVEVILGIEHRRYRAAVGGTSRLKLLDVICV